MVIPKPSRDVRSVVAIGFCYMYVCMAGAIRKSLESVCFSGQIQVTQVNKLSPS